MSSPGSAYMPGRLPSPPPPQPNAASVPTDERAEMRSHRLVWGRNKSAWTSSDLAAIQRDPMTYSLRIYLVMEAIRCAVEVISGQRVEHLTDLDFIVNTGTPAWDDRCEHRLSIKLHAPIQGTMELLEGVSRVDLMPYWLARVDSGTWHAVSIPRLSVHPATVAELVDVAPETLRSGNGRPLRSIQL